jgi:hypothetical protein
MALEKLNLAFVAHRFGARFERAEVAAPVGPGVEFARVEAIFARG